MRKIRQRIYIDYWILLFSFVFNIGCIFMNINFPSPYFPDVLLFINSISLTFNLYSFWTIIRRKLQARKIR